MRLVTLAQKFFKNVLGQVIWSFLATSRKVYPFALCVERGGGGVSMISRVWGINLFFNFIYFSFSQICLMDVIENYSELFTVILLHLIF